MRTKENKKIERLYLTNFHVAGFGYWEGCFVFDELKKGTAIKMVREDDNKFDPFAIALYYKETKLGFVPRGDNEDLSKYLDMGYGNMYDVRIDRISPDYPPERQLGVVVYIKKEAAVKK